MTSAEEAKAWAKSVYDEIEREEAPKRARLERFIKRALADVPTGDGSAACVTAPTSEQREYEYMRWRGWRRLVGGEAFFVKWRSDGGVMP